MYNKRLLSRAIFISITFVLLTSNISFADITVEKGEISTNTEIKKKYTIDDFYKILENSPLYTTPRNPYEQKNYVNKLGIIANQNRNQKDIQYQYHKNLAFYNSENWDRQGTIAELEIAKKYINNDFYENLHFYDQLARSYTEAWDFDNAALAYKNVHKIMNQNKNLLETHQIINDYVSRMYFHLGKGELERVFALYKEGKNILDNKEEKNLELEINLNEPIIQYYFITNDLKNIKKSINYHMELAEKTQNIILKDFALKQYLNYYKMTNDKANIQKTTKKLKKLNKEFSPKNNFEKTFIEIEKAEAYIFISKKYEDDVKYALEPAKYKKKAIKNAKLAEKYAKNAVILAEEYKDIAPTIYALALQKTGMATSKQGKLEETKAAMNKALEYYKKVDKSICSYFLFDSRLYFGAAYKDLGEYDKAIKEFNLLEKDLNKVLKNPFLEHMRLYHHMAETYSKMNKEKEAIKYIDKEIKISTDNFGADSIRTIDAYKTKVELYENLGLQEKAVKEAKELLFKTKKAVNAPTYDIEFECYFLLAKDYLAKGKLDDALANASKALKTAYTESNKDEANKLISKIYKQQGETLKSLKYKLK